MHHLGRGLLVLALAAVATALGLLPLSYASCVGPIIGLGPTAPDYPTASAAPVLVDRDEVLVVTGNWFRDGCSDAYVSTGCGPSRPLETETPRTGVDLVLTQGERTWVLGSADADGAPDYGVTWTVRIPSDAQNGPAILSADIPEVPIVLTD